MKKSKKIQKHKKYTKKHKNRRYSRKYKGGNGDDNEPLGKRTRYNPPPTQEEPPINTFMNMAMNIKNTGPMISAISAPDTVYELMKKILNLWNYAFENIRNPRHLDIARQIIDRIYNKLVIAAPQHFAMMDENNEEHYLIINYKSNQILEELFHIVSNISDKTLNEHVEIPSIDIFTAPNTDNPDIVYPIQEDNDVNIE